MSAEHTTLTHYHLQSPDMQLTHSLTHSLITRREASFAEYWIQFKVRFDGVHAFG